MSSHALLFVTLALAITAPILNVNGGKEKTRAGKEKPPAARVKERAEGLNQMGLLGVNLGESEQCQRDVTRYCEDEDLSNNFLVLECLQRDAETYSHLQPACQRHIWMYKRNLTLDARFEKSALSLCGNETLARTGCASSVGKKGHLITCLIEGYRKVLPGACRFFLTKMATIVFTDYRLIEGFYEKCEDDVVKFNCARLQKVDLEAMLADNDDDAVIDENLEVETPLEQGGTISCLQKQIGSKSGKGSVSEGCREAILRVSELQANDFALDRPLYYACREDRERFCPDVEAGEGRVYACLLEQKTEHGFSKACRAELHRRETLIEQDVRVDKRFYDACENALTAYKCSGSQDGMPLVDVAHALVCLNDAMNEGDPLHELTPLCRTELSALHRRVFADEPLSPRVVSACSAEIEANCNDPRYVENLAELFHCLMQHAVSASQDKKQREQVHADDDKPHPGLSNRCYAELRTLVREADVVEDVKVDPVLYEACEPVAKVACPDAQVDLQGDGTAHDSASLFVCLIDHMADKVMTMDCAKRLMEIEYFVTRDYHLDAALLHACRRDAREQCHAGDTKWFQEHADQREKFDRGEFLNQLENDPASEMDENEISERRRVNRKKRAPAGRAGLQPDTNELSLLEDMSEEIVELEHEDFILPCLFGLMRQDRLQEPCAVEVRRTLRQRSMFVGLMPEVERVCFFDLTRLCSDSEEVRQPGGEMRCLQDHFKQLHPRCRMMVANFTRDISVDASIDFYTYKLCVTPMRTFCQEQLGARSTWKHALEVHVREENDMDHHGTLMDCLIEHKNEESVTDECRLAVSHHQRVAELESVDVSVRLARACHKDVQELCSGLQHESKQLVLACLSEIWTIDYLRMNGIFYNKSAAIQTAQYEADTAGQIADSVEDEQPTYRISAFCRRELRKEFLEQEEDVELDDVVLYNCKSDIAKQCSNLDPRHDSRGEVVECLKEHFETLNETCRLVLFKHELRDTADERIDYALQKDCGGMIAKYCDGKLPSSVLECLKAKKTELDFDRSCLRVVVTREVIQAQDIRLNPQLTGACRNDVQHFCTDVLKEHAQKQREKADQMNKDMERNVLRGRENEHDLVENRVRQHRAIAYEFHGEVIHCLRERFIKALVDVRVNPRAITPSELLSEQCSDQLRLMMREAAVNRHLDPVLRGACTTELELCSDELENPHFLSSSRVVSSRDDRVRDLSPVHGIEVRIGVNRVEECLKQQFTKTPRRFGKDCRKEVVRLLQEARADVHVDPLLHKDCAMDITYYCQGVPLGLGQQFACLLHALDTKKSGVELQPACAAALKARMDMFNAAMEQAPAESLAELADQVINSPQRMYFGGVLISLTLAVFVIGICCGCTTRRRAKLVQKSK